MKSIIFGYVVLMIMLFNITFDIDMIDGYILSKSNTGKINRQTPKLRNNNNIIVCNEKYIYMKYLIGIRNFKKVYRILKDNPYVDIQNIINILNILNYINNTHLSNMTSNMTNNMINNNVLIINNTSVNNEKIAKNLILSNIYIDVSSVKYIQISTKNDTLIVELDKNNADISSTSSNNIHNIMYDISKIETLINSISLLLKFLNIN
jgi:hypothetical protein